MPATKDPPSSPSPPPPVQLTPGHRATALQKVFNEALAHTLRTCSYDNFAACFPTPAKYCASSLKALWRQMTEKMDELARSEFDDILKERNVIPSLNELDRLIAEARRRKARATGNDEPVPSHTLPPEDILSAHLAPFLAQQQSQLNAKTQTVQSQNAQLMQTIEAQREEIRRMVEGLEAVVADLDGAVKETDAVVGNGTIGREVDEMDVELAGAT
ncbi:MAG: hypothetical protein M1833_000604 [Piccolia ochrophora]|nr:MAG: hypothetical protein M1833_000604 [Piccolia ochrophora]